MKSPAYRALFLTLCLWCRLPALGAETVPPLCPSNTIAGNRFGLGLSLSILLPNRLPEFESNLLAYGPVIGIPIGKDALQIQGLYGYSTGLSLTLAELNYRFNIPTPFFSGFLLGGAHFLHYAFTGHNHDFFGGNGGLGFLLNMSRSFSMTLMMKVYLQDRAMLSFGGGFNFLL